MIFTLEDDQGTIHQGTHKKCCSQMIDLADKLKDEGVYDANETQEIIDFFGNLEDNKEGEFFGFFLKKRVNYG